MAITPDGRTVYVLSIMLEHGDPDHHHDQQAEDDGSAVRPRP